MALSLSLNFPPGSLLVHWSWLCEPCLSLPSLFFLDQLTVNPLGVCVHVCVCVCVCEVFPCWQTAAKCSESLLF